jgi:hypothetical protein
LRFRLHHDQLLEASITVPGYIDACLSPFYLLFLFHTQTTTSLSLHTSKHQESPLDSHNLLHHPTIKQQPTLSQNACHVRIPSLPWSSPKQASSSSSQVNHQPLWMTLSNHITAPTFHDNIQPARQTCTPVCSSISCPLPALHLHRLDCISEAGTFEHLFSLDPHLFNSKHDPQHAWLHPPLPVQISGPPMHMLVLALFGIHTCSLACN